MDDFASPTDRESSREARAEQSFRLIGFLPLIFFLAQAIHYWRINELGHMLWMCNIGNLLLAIGLFLNRPLLTRVAVIWLIPGLVVWFLYVALTWGLAVSSTLAHVGGITVGMVVLRKVRMDRRSVDLCFWLVSYNSTDLPANNSRGTERERGSHH